ncbi:hypothetical protein [Kamptonema formosum]|uniref:hypothetical protein n=1 Tax=Kamptonema formosum TaxID=331992 RepID=UPI00034BE475|nr:hypothetical protein [Oscillatoria sp. PCC 10802]
MSALPITDLSFFEEMNFTLRGDIKGGSVSTSSGVTIDAPPDKVKIKGPVNSSTSVQESSSGKTYFGEGVNQSADLLVFYSPLYLANLDSN